MKGYQYIKLPMPASWDEETRKVFEVLSNALTKVDTDTARLVDVTMALSLGLLAAGAKPGTTEEQLCTVVGRLIEVRMRWVLSTRSYAVSERRPFQ